MPVLCVRMCPTMARITVSSVCVWRGCCAVSSRVALLHGQQLGPTVVRSPSVSGCGQPSRCGQPREGMCMGSATYTESSDPRSPVHRVEGTRLTDAVTTRTLQPQHDGPVATWPARPVVLH